VVSGAADRPGRGRHGRRQLFRVDSRSAGRRLPGLSEFRLIRRRAWPPGHVAPNPLVLLLLGPVLGFFGSGHFSMFGGFVAELFPTAVRATGQGTSYNAGRLMGALAPYVIGVLASLPRVGIGLALGSTSALFVESALLII